MRAESPSHDPARVKDVPVYEGHGTGLQPLTDGDPITWVWRPRLVGSAPSALGYGIAHRWRARDELRGMKPGAMGGVVIMVPNHSTISELYVKSIVLRTVV